MLNEVVKCWCYTVTLFAGLSVSKLDACCQSCKWDSLRALKTKLLEISLVLGCIFFIKLARATNRARELSWACVCMLVRDHTCLIERPVFAYF